MNHKTNQPSEERNCSSGGFFVGYLVIASAQFSLLCNLTNKLSPLFCHSTGDAGEGLCSIFLPFLTAFIEPVPGYLA